MWALSTQRAKYHHQGFPKQNTESPHFSTHVYILEVNLEPLKITDVPPYQRLSPFWSDVFPQIIRSGRSTVPEGVRVVVSRGVVPSDPVGGGIDDLKVLGECAGGDLIIVSWVTPPTKPTLRGVTEDR